MSIKAVKVPDELTCAPYHHRDIKLNGLSIVESCTVTHRSQGSMFLEDHMLLVVLEGQNHITHGNQEYLVSKNKMLLLKKAIQIGYDKMGNPEKGQTYFSLMFFLKDEFLRDFVKMADVTSTETVEQAMVTVKPVKERLRGFFDSVVPYFEDPESVDSSLIRLKMLELLYDLVHADKNMLLQLLQLKQPVHGDIRHVVTENYASPVSIAELAYLSGRSLSSFKREFFAIYQVTPAQWIREKRLSKAKEMLSTDMAVTEVCYALGFENLAHFSRLYKSHHGCSPSADRPGGRPVLAV